MAYPFIHALSWAGFTEKVKTLGVDLKTMDGRAPDGTSFPVTFFENRMDGEVFTIVVDITDENQFLMPSTLRTLCRALRLHPHLFGLDLG